MGLRFPFHDGSNPAGIRKGARGSRNPFRIGRSGRAAGGTNMGFEGQIGYELQVISAAQTEPQNRRRSLVATDLLLAEEIIARPELPPRGVTTKRQLAITFAGAFEFQVGRSTSWVDPSRLLFADADQPTA